MSRLGRWSVNRRTEGRARRTLRLLAGHLRVPPGARVLELGCGGGGMMALLRERYHPELLVGTDLDPDQVAAARRFLGQRWDRLPPSVELREADALRLPFPDASFTHVFALLMLHHVEERHGHGGPFVRRPEALREVRRVLRPGGVLVYSDMFQRRAIRSALAELGFAQEFLRSLWPLDLGIFRAPS